ncbi:hypothetical protein TBLA_0B04935 [Henningerozyma blattae CBS 6284]|uniref:Sm protein F n=1 Tax=Henningerozyma blattae (strain ATCC 34711 / CBS 6284 / DSM 70876 / NBRC 10599 / NRRL Y-10934 / UCD 77-7) TaxID=1071380 RepID=I2GYX6_HENB6|nr:hypothetical protein TBLA_0B04935 [Tetrapisispora blattae CBS 6284]CCH59328.1 hypothetical protein TBLA_0B04935 [Tetrapisispora blattae CBS 6284]
MSENKWIYNSKLKFTPVNPKPYLRSLIDTPIIVTLKFNKTQYKGILVSTDNYFNIQLRNTEEIVDGKTTGQLGDIFIRCNNVLWIGQDLEKIAQNRENTETSTS